MPAHQMGCHSRLLNSILDDVRSHYTGSKRKTGQIPASASNSSGRPSLISPERFMKPGPVGTSLGQTRSSGLASSADSSTMRTRSWLRPRLSVTSLAALTFRTQSAPGKPPTTYRLPSTVTGVTGVDRGVPDLRPGTVNTTGLSPPKLRPSRDSLMKTLFAGFSHHGG